MRVRGWPYPFDQRPWDEIAADMHEMASSNDTMRHMAMIVDSVIDTRMTDALAAFTSMHDLMVVPTPIQELPFDLVAVRAPGSVRAPHEGYVLIEHLSVTGHNDAIERPVAEAVHFSGGSSSRSSELPPTGRFTLEAIGTTERATPRGHSHAVECVYVNALLCRDDAHGATSFGPLSGVSGYDDGDGGELAAVLRFRAERVVDRQARSLNLAIPDQSRQGDGVLFVVARASHSAERAFAAMPRVRPCL